VESCGILRLARRHGKRAGILGASTGIGAGRYYKAGLYRRALDESDFCFFRERLSCESMKRVCSQPEGLLIGPDPAFAMQAAEPDQVAGILDRVEGYGQARAAGQPIVAATVLEKGRVYAGFRPDLDGQARQRAHAEYVADILDALIAERDAFVLFLPHALEEDASDVTAARHVTAQMKSGPGHYKIVEEDCNARLLKGIIRQCDFVVGERTHSLIGGFSVGTPFVALTNRRDTRTHGIIGEMCQCEHQIVDMDVMDGHAAARRVLELHDLRDSIRKTLNQLRPQLSRQLLEVARLVKGRAHVQPSP
jgi:polysaccharide pyruvyl transferase WcaK-like protein